MTVNEMHIAVNLGVQKIASFQVDNLLPQEIDHELNLAMLRFIKNRYGNMSNRMGKGFEQSQKRIDDLRTLVVENSDYTSSTNVPVFTSNSSDIYVDRFTLPMDYMFLVSVRAHTNYICNTDVLPYVAQDREGYEEKYQVKVDLTPPVPGYVLTGLSYFNGIWLNFTTSPLGEEITYDMLRDASTFNAGYNAEISVPTPTIDTPTVDSNHIYIVNTFGFDLSTGTPGGGNYIRTAWCLPGNYTSAQFTYSADLHHYIRSPRFLTTGDKKISLAKFAQHDDVYYILNDPFNKGTYSMPFYNVEENALDVYTDKIGRAHV